jgi:hypothetical protein
MIMKLFFNFIFCIATMLSLSVAFASGTPSGLTVTCSVLDCHFSTAANVPIWLDVKVTNSGSVTFTGDDLGDSANYGAVVTTSPVTKALLSKVLPGSMDRICMGLSIPPGGQQDFRILLNDYFPDLHGGVMSGSVILPIDGMGGTGWFTLVAPFKVNVAPPLNAEQMQPVCDTIAKLLTATVPEQQWAIHSDNALPDAYAIPMLLRVVTANPNAFSAINCLGQRPRTPETEKALQSLAESSNPDVTRIAKSYLLK